MALGSYLLSPASQPHFATHEEVHAAIMGLMVSKTIGPNGIPNRAIKHLPKREASFHVHVFYAPITFHKNGSKLE